MGPSKDILESYAAEQGWDDSSKIDLLCHFIDNLSIIVDLDSSEPSRTMTDFVETLDKWLENQAKWENSECTPPP